MQELEAAVRRALDAVEDPETGRGLLSAGRIGGLVVRADGRIGFALETTRGEADEPLRRQAEAAVAAVPGALKVTAVLTADAPPGNRPGNVPPAQGPAQAPMRGQDGRGQDGREQRPARLLIAVASGKGGVGKSTVALNLAAAAARAGLRTGILDADIHGPSIPTMLGTVGRRPETTPQRRMRPIVAHGLASMSIGYLVDPEKAVAWRGPMATSAIQQMISDTDWGDLDVLFFDTPPGTGEVMLTLVQRLPLDGAVIVSTPQEVALADVRRGVALFRQTAVPLLGVIENMAWFDQGDGTRVHIFGEGGVQKTAAELEAPFLGALPILPALRESGDRGAPVSDGLAARAFDLLAEAVLNAAAASGGKSAPPIRFV